ncbi:hypothetical protein [Aquimarina sediminis]|uniref:hypothetical protein n=1 Tax=Aquimarina sediminis TaxID=2070536 RepID=UPI000CA074DB|nr:hypothetical protein [Aquimarina sediminis]
MKISNFINRSNSKIISILLFFTQFSAFTQEIDINAVYQSAIKAYDSQNYQEASNQFTLLLDKVDFQIKNEGVYYSGACIYALNNQSNQAFELLEYLADKKWYSKYDQISTDDDLKNLHISNQWSTLLKKVKNNLSSLPERNSKFIKKRILETKTLLTNDNGKLWGENIWHNDFLILDFDYTIYSLNPLANSKTKDTTLFYTKVSKNALSLTNSVQEYKGKEYATILTNYLNDGGATIIHELFHTLQRKHKTFNGEPISYLDNYDARQWLRLEFYALQLALHAINNNKDLSEIQLHVTDAMIFRKLRQTKYNEFLTKELEIETLEGLAEYTGIRLSNTKNKYDDAISQINEREAAPTYTRPFPYATGPAYGLIFDYLQIDWRNGLDHIYNFLNIYETQYLNEPIFIDKNTVKKANERNNFDLIHKEELEKKVKQEKLISFYTEMFMDKPTLSVTSIDPFYGRSYDMYGTLSLNPKETVYASIKGTANSKSDFGNFHIKDEVGKLGTTGVLGTWIEDLLKFSFPLPIQIDGNKILGEFYEIELNKGWEIIKTNVKGDLKIVKRKK